MHERFEDRVELVRRNPRARVGHAQLDGTLTAYAIDVDRTATRRELAGVRHEVHDDLSHLLAVGTDHDRIVARAPRVAELLRVDLRAAHRIDRESDVANGQRRNAELDATRVDAREVEKVVDDRQQMPLVRFDATEDRDLLRREVPVDSHLEQLEVPLNRRERRTQLVAHHPQEIRLRTVCFLGRVARGLLLLEHGRALQLELSPVREVAADVRERERRRDERHEETDREQDAGIAGESCLRARPRSEQQSLIVSNLGEQGLEPLARVDDSRVAHREGRGIEPRTRAHIRDALEIVQMCSDQWSQGIHALRRCTTRAHVRPQARHIVLGGAAGVLKPVAVVGVAVEQVVPLRGAGIGDARAKHVDLFEHRFGVTSGARCSREFAEAHVRQGADQCDRHDAGAEIEADFLVKGERHFYHPGSWRRIESKRDRATRASVALPRRGVDG